MVTTIAAVAAVFYVLSLGGSAIGFYDTPAKCERDKSREAVARNIAPEKLSCEKRTLD